MTRVRASVRGVRHALLAGLIFAAPTVLAQSQPLPARRVVAHEVPVPTTVSPDMQARIARPDMTWPTSFPTTNAGWQALDNPDPAASRARLDSLLAQFDLELKKVRFGNVACHEITPRKPADRKRGRLLVHLHGGGYVFGAGERGLAEAILVAGTSGIRTISVDYRLPPDYPFPTPLDDVVSAWKAIAADHPDAHIGLFGNSAGAALGLSLVQLGVREHLPLPRAIVAATPWSDLSETGDSYFTNKHLDPVPYHGILSVAARQFAGGAELKDPRLSPVYGDFGDFPPTLLLSGTRDIFLSNAVRVDRKLRDAGRESSLILYEGQSHGRHLAGWDYPETRTTLQDIGRFWDRHL